ncbi:hypothetical protein [Chryseobacterium bernardetii]|uniref:hypothetical protein n=1 Tax=Chryseobacterium bernardetii TaxID=1241978 RepID=UPI00162A4D43|nr:hypothetical protein [Chryseobacterium bernardetii]
MKTKIIMLTAIAATLLYSCSADRDENVTPVTEKKTRPENLKLNPINQNFEVNDFNVKSDTIRALDSANGNELPADGGDPKDVPVPPRR